LLIFIALADLSLDLTLTRIKSSKNVLEFYIIREGTVLVC
jgi:hypothetical protein